MDNVFLNICNICSHMFKTDEEEEKNCIYCWYDIFYGKSLVQGYKYLSEDSSRFRSE